MVNSDTKIVQTDIAIQGDVNTSGGDFIGRDQIINVINIWPSY